MIAKLIVLLCVLALACADIVRFPMHKQENKDFVAGIKARREGSLHAVSSDGSGAVVIKDYQNSQYYGEIQCTCVSDEFHLCTSPPPYASSFYFFIV